MKKLSKALKYGFLSLWALSTIFPLAWVIMNSFKTSQEITANSFTWPEAFNLENYKTAIENNILRGYANSLIISISVVVAVLLIGSLAGYILAKFVFPGKEIFRSLVVGSLMIPIFATIVPVFGLLVKMNLFNNYLGLILPQIAGNLAFTIIVISSYMSTIPNEMEEAAVVEGCNPLQVFFHVILPISKSSLAAAGIFVFLWSYNDLFSSLIILRTRDKMPINVMLTDISSQYGTDYGLMAAVIVVIVVPVLIFYILMQKNIVEGMTAGAIKG